MSLVLNTNIDSLSAQGSLSSSGMQLSTALQQLSSGLRINTAADDAAGYAIVQGMTSQIGGLNQAAQNANDGVSLAQTANGALQEITSDLQSMRDLAVESLNATNSAQDRSNLDAQYQQLSADIDNVAKTANFNGVNLLDGSFQGEVFQTGANAGQTVAVSAVASARTAQLGNYQGVSQNNVAVVAGLGTAATEGDVSLSVGGTSYDLGSQDGNAATLATAINNLNVAGLTVTANAATSAAGTAAASAVGASGPAAFTINGTTIQVQDTTGATGTNVVAAINAINAETTTTGVSAASNAGGGITLSNVTGGLITVGAATTPAGSGATGANLTDFGLGGLDADVDGNGNASMTGTLNISYTAQPGVSGDVTLNSASATTGGGFVGAAAGDANFYAIGASGTSVAASGVTTIAASNSALSIIDAALQQVSSTGAQLGAYQNRFQAAITGLNTDSTNLSSAKSGIQDTDYAAATSALSKAQILQQASTAMVAQANTIPQNVLTLLQKLP